MEMVVKAGSRYGNIMEGELISIERSHKYNTTTSRVLMRSFDQIYDVRGTIE